MKQNLKKTTSLFLIICLVLVMFSESAYAEKLIFQDSLGHWAEDAILNLTAEGVISGFPDGLCHPDEMITRAEFTALVDRKIERNQDGAVNRPSDFTDIKGHWAEKNITKLTSLEIILEEEYPDKQFSPDGPITRLEMVKMLVRALGTENHSENCICELDFTDAQLIKSEDKIYVCMGKKYHIISGYPDGRMQPTGSATRAEAFKMLVNQEEARAQIKREKEQSTVVENPEVKNSNGGSGGASYVPEPQFSFILPETVYVGEEIEVVAKSQYVSAVSWAVLKNDISVEIPDVMEGELKADGGIVKIKEKGTYTFTGLTRKFENGIISVNHKKFLGYTKDEDGNLVIVPEEAVIVKRIFKEYLEGSSIIQICKGLEIDGIKTVTGLDCWHPGTIDKMLSND